jgi:hypothetical protein
MKRSGTSSSVRWMCSACGATSLSANWRTLARTSASVASSGHGFLPRDAATAWPIARTASSRPSRASAARSAASYTGSGRPSSAAIGSRRSRALRARSAIATRAGATNAASAPGCAASAVTSERATRASVAADATFSTMTWCSSMRSPPAVSEVAAASAREASRSSAEATVRTSSSGVGAFIGWQPTRSDAA